MFNLPNEFSRNNIRAMDNDIDNFISYSDFPTNFDAANFLDLDFTGSSPNSSPFTGAFNFEQSSFKNSTSPSLTANKQDEKYKPFRISK